MKLFSRNIKRILYFFVFPEMELSSSDIKNIPYIFSKKSFSYIFARESFSYISKTEPCNFQPKP